MLSTVSSYTLESLAPKVAKLARCFRNIEDPEELEQRMMVSLFERSQKDPLFLQQKESYILHQARFVAWATLRDAKTTDQYTIEDDGEGEILEMVADDRMSPEQAMIAAEDAEIIRQAIANLGGREAEVIRLMLAGLSTGEIAERFGCNPAAVSCYKGRAISKIRAALVM